MDIIRTEFVKTSEDFLTCKCEINEDACINQEAVGDVDECVQDEDGGPSLSEHTLAALREFYSEEEQRQTLQQQQGEVTEDWQLSQFWYDDASAALLAKEALAVAGTNGSVACVSCPTVYRKLHSLNVAGRLVCLEFDKRFSVHGDDFIFYDYNDPLSLPEDCRDAFDLVLCDPPFLADECLTKVSETVKFLTSRAIILCTGTVMESLARKLLRVDKCSFHPTHSNNLANEFSCYTNYKPHYLNDAT